jgi:hypothetical protein
MTRHWAPDGRVRWCWLELGGAALMLQEKGRTIEYLKTVRSPPENRTDWDRTYNGRPNGMSAPPLAKKTIWGCF